MKLIKYGSIDEANYAIAKLEALGFIVEDAHIHPIDDTNAKDKTGVSEVVYLTIISKDEYRPTQEIEMFVEEEDDGENEYETLTNNL